MDVSAFQHAFFDSIGNFETIKFILDLLPDDGIVIKDREGRVVLHNRHDSENYNLLDPGTTSTVGQKDYDRFPLEIAEKQRRTDQQVIRTKKPIINGVYTSPDMPGKMTIFSKAPIFDAAGKVIGIVGIYRFLESTTSKDIPAWHSRLADAIQYLQDHYAEHIAIEKLASIAHCSVSQFKRLFKKMLGDTPNEYIIRMRINNARHLLQTTDRTISDISSELGFFDQSHLIRHFKRLRGCTPKQYRQQTKRKKTVLGTIFSAF